MRILRCALAVALLASFASSALGERMKPLKGTPPGQLIEKAKKNGYLRVIISVRDDSWRPEGLISRDEVALQRNRSKLNVAAIIRAHPDLRVVAGWQFETIPAFLAEAKEKDLHDLIADDRVDSIEEDIAGDFVLKETTVKMGAVAAHSRAPVGYSGTNQIVVVIDSGVDKDHPFFGTPSRVLDSSGACFSGQLITGVDEISNVQSRWSSICPNTLTTQVGSGAAVPCTFGDMSVNENNCHHGTRVAGVVAGDNQQTGAGRMTGVAPSAKVIPIQVGSRYCTSNGCTKRSLKASTIYALDYVASTLFDAHGSNIAAVNISLSFAGYAGSSCDVGHAIFYNAVANVRSREIAVVAATGNDFEETLITVPACLSNVISVSSTDDDDSVPPYANAAQIMTLWAPGGANGAGIGILTSQNRGCIGCELYWEDHGTSLAAPHVAGAFAILRQRHPGATVQSLLGTLVRTGVMVTDNRFGSASVTKPRINVNEALDEPVALAPPTSLTATASSPATSELTWTAANPASQRTSYRVRFRTTHSGGWTVLTSTQATTYTHENVAAGVLYEYEVVVTDSVGNSSVATTDYMLPLFHADDPLTAQSTNIRGVHVSRLREAADAWRTFAGLPVAFSYDPPTGVVQAAHLADIRVALNAARSLMGLGDFAYAGVVPPAVGGVIDVRHVDQLRTAMK